MREQLQDILNNIHNDKIRLFTASVLDKVEPDFWTMPASTSGKYHPPECRGEGGLVLHVRRACMFANMIFNSYGFENTDIRGDIVISALLLHDIGKKQKYDKYWEYYNHPIVAAKKCEEFKHLLDSKIYSTIVNCIIWHMGPFSPKSIKKEITKYTFLELIVYNCDYLASQATLKFEG